MKPKGAIKMDDSGIRYYDGNPGVSSFNDLPTCITGNKPAWLIVDLPDALSPSSGFENGTAAARYEKKAGWQIRLRLDNPDPVALATLRDSLARIVAMMDDDPRIPPSVSAD